MRNSDPRIRLRSMLRRDKLLVPDNFHDLLRADIRGVLSDYMDISGDDIALRLDVTEEGEYELRVFVRAPRLLAVPRKI